MTNSVVQLNLWLTEYPVTRQLSGSGTSEGISHSAITQADKFVDSSQLLGSLIKGGGEEEEVEVSVTSVSESKGQIGICD